MVAVPRLLMSLAALTASLALAICISRIVHAEHLDEYEWLKGAKGRDNQSCCGVLDCVEATVALLDDTPPEYIVMVGDVELTLPAAWVHPSRGHTGVWCFVPQTAEQGRPAAYVDAQGRPRAIPPKMPTRDNT